MPAHIRRGFMRLWLAICIPWMVYWGYQYLTDQPDEAVFWGPLIPMGSLVLFGIGAWVCRGFRPADCASGEHSSFEDAKDALPGILDRVANLPIPRSIYVTICVAGPIICFIFGAALFKYAGLTMAIPAVIGAVVYYACYRISAEHMYYRLSFAILVGQGGWMILGALMMIGRTGDARPLEVLAEGLLVLAGVFWLFRTTSAKAVLALVVYELIAVAANLYMANELSVGSGSERAFAVHTVLRLAAILTLTAAILESRRRTPTSLEDISLRNETQAAPEKVKEARPAANE